MKTAQGRAQPVDSRTPGPITRRQWLLGAGCSLAALAGCRSTTDVGDEGSPRLTVQPHAPTSTVTPGTYRLNLSSGRDGFLYVPPGYVHGTPRPLVVMLHGAYHGADSVAAMSASTDAFGCLMLTPESRGNTWIVPRFGPGSDIEFIGRALEQTFSRCSVRTDRMGLFGFSDGASYALSAGLVNGDFFSHIAAYSPGYLVEDQWRGQPRIFIAHGTADDVLPVDISRQLVPALRDDGYDVQYDEFDGVHAIYQTEVNLSLQWFLD